MEKRRIREVCVFLLFYIKKPFAFDIGSDIPRQTQLFSGFSASPNDVLSAKLVLTHSDTASKTSLYIQKLRKYSALFAIGILRLHLEMDISYLCKTEKEINNIVVGDKIIK